MGKHQRQDFIYECLDTDYFHIDDLQLKKISEVVPKLDLLVENHLGNVITDVHYTDDKFNQYFVMSKFMIDLNPDLKEYVNDPKKVGYSDNSIITVTDHSEIVKISSKGLFPGMYYAICGKHGNGNYVVLVIEDMSGDHDQRSYLYSTWRVKMYFIGDKRNKYMKKYYALYDKYKAYADTTKSDLIYDKTSSKKYTYLQFKTFDQMVFKDKDKLIKYIDHFIDNIPQYYQYGVTPKLSILLYGKPGCGKSTFYQALAKHMGVSKIQCVNANHFTANDNSSYSGSSQRSKGILYPTIYALDDVDCIAGSREDDDSMDNKSILQQLLAFLDNPGTFNYKAKDGLYYPISVVIATTNYYEKLDPAVQRFGRFDLKIEMKEFDAQDAEEMCQLYKLHLDDVVDMNEKDRDSFVISPAELQALCMEKIDASIKDTDPIKKPDEKPHHNNDHNHVNNHHQNNKKPHNHVKKGKKKSYELYGLLDR